MGTGRVGALAPYVVVALVHLGAQAVDADGLAAVTQVLLMPLLAGWFALQPVPRSRLRTLVLVALGFSWLGDSVPRVLDGDPAFMAMIAMFLVAQVTYSLAFRTWVADSVLRTNRPVAAVYVAVAVALVAVCAPGAGAIAPAVVVYAGCLVTMTLLATGVHRLAAIGGAIYLASDAMIALDAFADWWSIPGQDVAVMATYCVAQLLIVLGVVARVREGAATPSAPVTATR